MANRRRLRRGASALKRSETGVKVERAADLPWGAQATPTDLIHKGRPVVWLDGILYCDGKAIGRRPQP
jgi:hypothetical protein